jgi:hypothetical protein
MSIALVQTSAYVKFVGTLSVGTTLTGVSSGNTLILIVAHANYSATNAANVISATDAQGSYLIDQETTGGRFSCDIMRLANANAGTHTVTATANYGTAANSFGGLVLTEWSGIQGYDTGTGVDQESTSNTGPVATGSTGTLSTASDMAIALAILAQGTPSGFTNIELDTVSVATYSAAYKALSSNAGASANFGTVSPAGEWCCNIACYVPLGSGGGAGRNGAEMMMGMGS